MFVEVVCFVLGSRSVVGGCIRGSKEEDNFKEFEDWVYLFFWFKLFCLEKSKYNYFNNWVGRFWGFNTILFFWGEGGVCGGLGEGFEELGGFICFYFFFRNALSRYGVFDCVFYKINFVYFFYIKWN